MGVTPHSWYERSTADLSSVSDKLSLTTQQWVGASPTPDLVTITDCVLRQNKKDL